MNNKKLRAVSLFSGCGGADLGLIGGFTYLGKRYAPSGIEIVHASDIDRFAVETYNANFDHPAEIADIRKLKFTKGMADIVIGGFPCQNFSTLNPTKRPDLKSNQLFWEMARVVNDIKPKVFIAENVKGFYRLFGGAYFKMALKEFEKLGYTVYHQMLNASEYGIPQKRERLLMVGIRNDINAGFDFPQPTHGERSLQSKMLVPLKSIITKMRIPEEKFYFSKKAVEGVKKAKPNMKRALAQDLNEPCLTITSHLAKVSIYSRDPILLVDPKTELYRRFTVQEAAGIQSFPSSFKFPVSDTQAYRQVGNAVPPVMFWHVAQAVIKALGRKQHLKSGTSASTDLGLNL